MTFGKGFTLVELTVTLVIIGALAAASAPIFFTRDTFEARGFFEDVMASVRYAQKLAVATGCTVRVEITGNTLTLQRGAGGPPACNTPPYTGDVVDPAGRPTFSRAPRAGSGITMTSVNFTFSPLGAASLGSDTTIDVTSSAAGTQQFRIWRVTGFVERL